MSVDLAKLKRALACSLLATGLALATGIGSALTAEQPSVDQIIKALTPNLTRSLTISPAESARNGDETQFLDTLRNRTTRSLTLNEREKIATIVRDKPSIAIEINFEFNSATLAPSAMSTARTLGEALSSADLKGSTFIVEGHTDAKGGETFNQRPLGAARGGHQSLPRGALWDTGRKFGGRPLRQDQAQEQRQSFWSRKPPRPGRQHGE
ncbi:MAG: hypothetical protein WBF22_15325 [Methylocella sp.]